MLARMESYIKSVLTFTQTEYPGVIYAWDVVNEAMEEEEADCWRKKSLWYKTVGEEFVLHAFRFAKKYIAEGVKLFYNEQVKSFTVEGQLIQLNLHEAYGGSTSLLCDLADPELFRQEMAALLESQLQSGILESYHFYPAEESSPYDIVLPLLIVGAVLMLVWFILMSRANSGAHLNNFGKALLPDSPQESPQCVL